jgi:hypothetical protein
MKELAAWMASEKEKKNASRIAESRGCKRFGNSFIVDDR